MGKTPIEWRLSSGVEGCHLVAKGKPFLLDFGCQSIAATSAVIAGEIYNQFGLGFLYFEKRKEHLTEKSCPLSMQPDNALRFPFWIPAAGCRVVKFDRPRLNFLLEPFDHWQVCHSYRDRRVVSMIFRSNATNPNTSLAIDESGYVGGVDWGEAFYGVRRVNHALFSSPVFRGSSFAFTGIQFSCGHMDILGCFNGN
jgi:hypothetical protein